MLFYVFFRAWGKGKGGEGEGNGYVVHCMQVGRGGERFCYTIKICYVVNFLLFLLFFARIEEKKRVRERWVFSAMFLPAWGSVNFFVYILLSYRFAQHS